MATDAGGLDEFGVAVGVFGDAAVIGAHNDDDKGSDAGAAYACRRNGNAWTQEAKLTASDGAAGDRFGHSVAISGDIAVVGAYQDDGSAVDSGSAYVFRFNGSQWVQEAKLTASDADASDYFGWAVGIDGNVIVVGAYGEDDGGTSAGAAYVFGYTGSNWVQEARLKASDADASDYFGVSVACSGTRVLVGAYLDEQAATSAGSAYVFRDTGSAWVQEGKLLPAGLEADDRFGHSVALSGDVAVVGALHDDDKGVNGGAAYVFERSGSSWPQAAKLLASDGAAQDKFGVSVAASGDLIVVGAFWNDEGTLTDAGAAYAFRDTGSWTQETKFLSPDGYFWEYFGNSVAASGGVAIVGSYNDNSGGMDAGAAYVFENSSGPQPGCSSPTECNDGNGCTVDTCQNGQCVHTPAVCNDSNSCTTDSCSNGACVYTPLNCADTNACTVDTCSNGACVHTPMNCADTNACTVDTCSNGTCVHTPMNCNDGTVCTVDSCSNGVCAHVPVNCNDNNACTVDSCNAASGCLNVPVICPPGEVCSGGVCDPPGCDADGTCEGSEDCVNCPEDCFTGPGGGECGNGVCEPPAGEDCLSCAADCRGKQGGNPSQRFCCGDGAGQNPVGCEDPRCSQNGFACSDTIAPPTCCGDGSCDGDETSANCAIDCGGGAGCGDQSCGAGENKCTCPQDCGQPPAAESNCTNAIDDDCDAQSDCDDSDCAGNAACTPSGCDADGTCEPSEDCETCPGDCESKLTGPQSKRFCCGNGIAESAEGNGAICDGNY
jgi:hypothetical protein